MLLRMEASTMGDLVRVKKNVGWRVLFLAALALVAGTAGTSSLGAMDLDRALGAAPTEVKGTADNPFVGPEPEGVRASQLVSVLSETSGDMAIVRLVGDGEFVFSAFQLDSPARFVMDLPGVVKTTDQGSLLVEHSIVAQVRLAQYRSGPEPVSRVVFDLLRPAVPHIESTPEGLTVSFTSESLTAKMPSVEMVPDLEPEMDGADEDEPIYAAEPEAEAVAEVVAAVGLMEKVPVAAAMMEPMEPMEPMEIEESPAYTAAEPMTETPVEIPEPDVEEIEVTEMGTMPSATPSATPSTTLADEYAEPVAVDTAVEEQPVEVVEPAATGLEGEETGEFEPVIPEESFQVALAEPIWKETEEIRKVTVEPMPLPRVAAPTPVPVAQDRARFGIGNVQVEEPAAPTSPPSPIRAYQPQTLGTERRYFGEPMDLSLQDADVKDVLRSFAQLSGVNLVLQPGVRGRVTVELVQVPWDQALEQILKITDLGYELDGNIMRVAPISKLRQEAEEQQRLLRAQALSVPLSTVIRRISYAKASEVARVLTARGGVMSQRGSVIVDRRTNTLIIKELPAFLNTVIAIIENLDIPEPQVMIEARIIETTKRFSRSLGIQWGFGAVADAAHGNATGLQFPNNGTVDGGVNLLTGGQNGFINLSLGNILSTFNLDATLNAAESEGLINILSAPRIATLNNERASIQSGLQIPIQTVANNTVSVQFVNATLRLDVTPQVTAEGTVLMDINIQKREPQLAFAVQGSTNAPISTKEARTRVIVRDGGTTVIGGIYEVSTDQGEDRVPGLARLPIIKHLFKNKRRTDENKELLIFITPRVTKL